MSIYLDKTYNYTYAIVLQRILSNYDAESVGGITQ